MRSWDSSVSIVTRLTRWTVQSLDLGMHKSFPLLCKSRPALGPGVPGVKRSGPEANHLPPSSAKLKCELMYTTTPTCI
jgi:hypothetical protein